MKLLLKNEVVNRALGFPDGRKGPELIDFDIVVKLWGRPSPLFYEEGDNLPASAIQIAQHLRDDFYMYYLSAHIINYRGTADDLFGLSLVFDDINAH